jgi:predicted phage terminase large subunit-like protein
MRSESLPQQSAEHVDDEAMLAATLLRTVLRNPWIPHRPTEKQAEFLLLPHREVLYGGAAGGGKSDALLMAALQYVEVPHYAALIVRRTYADLALPDAIMARSHEWLRATANPPHWNGDTKTWTWPNRASLSFGYLQTENDKYRYQSAMFQYVGFDELTQFEKSQYTYLFSRLRRLADSQVPLRMRAGSNPGGVGHEWVRERFLDKSIDARQFVPALLSDNPHLDRAEYMTSLGYLDDVTKAQLLEGNWFVRPEGGVLKREWFNVVDALPDRSRWRRTVRAWDLAGTKPKSKGSVADWTVGLRILQTSDGSFWITDMRRFQEEPAAVEANVKNVATQDGQNTTVALFQDPAQAGKYQAVMFTKMLAGYPVVIVPTTRGLHELIAPVRPQAQIGNIHLLRGDWNEPFLSEVSAFPFGVFDDIIAAMGGAFYAMFRDEDDGIVVAPEGMHKRSEFYDR